MSLENLVGQTLNRYKIVSMLGEGGMGAVFKGHDVTLQRDVAVKVMHPHFARQPDFRERFLQEARTAAKMAHPSIVQVFDFGQASSLLFIVMEFIPGENLGQLLTNLREQKKWLSLEQSVEVVQMVAQALDYAHSQGILHRDIKPANIMLRPEPAGKLPFRPVLTDLGLAKLLDSPGLTQEGTAMGTPAYMSPEQTLGEPSDSRSDVYSLGVLLFELSTARLPFPARNLSEAVRYHTKETPPSPRSIRPDLPAALEAVIIKAMAKDPAQRFQSAGDLASALTGAFSGGGAPAAIKASAPPPASPGSTQFDEKQGTGRGGSIFNQFAAPEVKTQDRIQMLLPDKTTRDYPVKGRETTVGRDESNDIVIPAGNASRQHARIIFDGTNYQVLDLNSTNGTFLGTTRLLPGIPEAWSPDKPIQIGQVFLRLVRAEIKPGVEATAVYASPVGQAPNLPPAGPAGGTNFAQPGGVQRPAQQSGARVALTLADTNLVVDPGRSIIVPVTLFNQGSVVDHFQVGVTGIPAEWIPTPINAVQMMPGDQKIVNVMVQPPRTPTSLAGDYRVQFNVGTSASPAPLSSATATLKVNPFSQYASQVFPLKVKTNRTGKITVTNQGNYAETFNIQIKDRGDEISFSPPVLQLNIPPGEAETAEYIGRARKRKLIGAATMHPFSTEIVPSGLAIPKGSPGGPQPQLVSGEIISGPIIPAWLITFVIVACMVSMILVGLYIQTYNRQVSAIVATNAAQETINAAQIAGLDSDSDGLPDAEELRLGTDPFNADSDGDGLNDKEEIDSATNPLNPDTDGDGLNDGDEKRFGTNPNVIDTDGDTLSDGDEVNRIGSSPTKEDTDGDGLKDNVDPSPGQLPTPTPLPTATPPPSATPEPTATPAATPTPTPIPGAWHGSWTSNCEFLNCATVELTHFAGQNNVSGTFADGNGTLTGTAQGNFLSGQWSVGGTSGNFSFWQTDDSSAFRGNWDKVYDWCGSRSGSLPTPCGLASWGGTWQTTCGASGCETMTIIQTGSSATAIYAGGVGSLQGTIEGTVFSGNWSRNSGTGTFKFFMQQNGKQFNGNWNGSNEWCGFREGAGNPNPCLNATVIINKFEPPSIIIPIIPILIPTLKP